MQSTDHVTPLGWLIKRFIAEQEITQRELAKRIDVGPSYLSAVIKGAKGNVSQSLLERIFVALNLNGEEKSELLRAQALSCNTYEIKDVPPWKWNLAADFYNALPYMSPDVAGIVQAALAMAAENRRHEHADASNLENKM
ncbi:helix-turn-helix domain-containing protein [Undibacterium sp. TJN19]|uniref:helix-turn-helix domain-containing protein n=1 Tax=Undibacterium sp. TJN19 TaxID=3413055 RepID=UPI003BF33F0C